MTSCVTTTGHPCTQLLTRASYACVPYMHTAHHSWIDTQLTLIARPRRSIVCKSARSIGMVRPEIYDANVSYRTRTLVDSICELDRAASVLSWHKSVHKPLPGLARTVLCGACTASTSTVWLVVVKCAACMRAASWPGLTQRNERGARSCNAWSLRSLDQSRLFDRDDVSRFSSTPRWTRRKKRKGLRHRS